MTQDAEKDKKDDKIVRHAIWQEHAQMAQRVQFRATLHRQIDLTEQEMEAWKQNTARMGFKEARDEYNKIVAEKIAQNERVAANDAKIVADLKHRLDKAVAAHAAATARYEGLSVLGPCHTWLARVIARGGTVQHVQPPPVTLKTPGTYQDAAAAIREKIATIEAQIEATNKAPSTKAEYRQRAHAEVNALADAGALRIDLHARHVNPLALRNVLSVALHRTGLAAQDNAPAITHFSLSGDPAPVLVHLLRPMILEQIDAAIDAADDSGAMDDATREKKLAALAAQKLALEREEESAIVAAESIGFAIPRRYGADPRAVLEVQET